MAPEHTAQHHGASDNPALNTDEVVTLNQQLSGWVENEQVSEHVIAVHYLNTEAMTIEASSVEQFVGVTVGTNTITSLRRLSNGHESG